MKKEEKAIRITVNGNEVKACVGQKLDELVFTSNHCGGNGKCGKCKVIAKGKLSSLTPFEKKTLSEQEINDGVRLACLVTIEGECEIKTYEHVFNYEVELTKKERILSQTISFKGFGVAIDIGTTTLALALYNDSGALVGEIGAINPQVRYGSDVISRIKSALSGNAQKLREEVVTAINSLIVQLAEKSGIDNKKITSAVVTGNTVMLSLFTGVSVQHFARAPFNATELFGKTYKAKSLRIETLEEEVEVYLPRCISPFVGADVTCAIVGTNLIATPEVGMLADVGTNGEIALWDGKNLTVCSTSAGPAFEGVDLACGTTSRVGAIDKVELCNDSLTIHVLGECEAQGICGSGVIDLIACLLKTEKIDESGYFEAKKIDITTSVYLTQEDVRQIQLAKSAICAGIKTLLLQKNLTTFDVSVLYLAGGLGTNLNVANASLVGLIPANLSAKTRACGNSALIGASKILVDAKKRKKSEDIAMLANTVSLATNSIFMDEYIENMSFKK